METKLLGFIDTLRQHQVRVSTAESLDAMRTLALVGYNDKPQLKRALSLVLAKTAEEKLLFDDTFELFFSGNRLKPQDHDPEPETETGATSALDIEQALATDDALSGAVSSPLAQLLLDPNPLRVATAIANGAADSGLSEMRYFTQKGQFSRRLMQQLGVETLQLELAQLQQFPGDEAREIARQLDMQLQQLREQVRAYVEEEFLLTANNEGRKLQENALKQARLSSLEQRYFEELRSLVRKLAKKLAARHSRRPRVERSGKLDVAKTLRKNIRHDSVLFETYWRKKRKQPTRLFVLCDVSGSVSAYAKFLLLFLYSLHDILPKMRSFCFSNRLGEVTELFDQLDAAEAIEQALKLHGMGGSDYGRSLEDFEQLCFDQLNSNSTVIILGDGRNNRGDPRLDILSKAYQRARQVLWLNPESRNSWGTGDSEMRRYQSACHQVSECQSLQQLERFIDQLLRHNA